ncbi:MAG TPA: hypothetical protein VK601_19950 [Kofleriaceae bacterium]|nr:hypothetical protein [Kofleriaceae bacterium]
MDAVASPPSPQQLPVPGRIAFALGIAAIGAQDVLGADFVRGLQPVPGWVPARAALAVMTGAVLVTAGAAIAAGRGVRTAARALTALLGLSLLCLHLPALLGHLDNGSAWTAAFEVVALTGAAAVIAFPANPAAGRIGYGITLPVFGVLHFVFREYTASVIPAWIPGHMFWALATGVAHIAGGAALVLDRRARLAASLLAVMFGTWVVILHAPRVAAHPAAGEWTSLCVALAMCGGAWLLAGVARPAADHSASTRRPSPWLAS